MKASATTIMAIYGAVLSTEQTAARMWPNERLSRAEISRRFLLAGAMVLPQLRTIDQASAERWFQQTMGAPEGEKQQR